MSVPSTLISASWTGSTTETGTFTWAARWNTTSGLKRVGDVGEFGRADAGDVHRHLAALPGSRQVLERTGAEVVDDEDLPVAIDEEIDQVAADESGPARDECSPDHAGGLNVTEPVGQHRIRSHPHPAVDLTPGPDPCTRSDERMPRSRAPRHR